MLLEMGNLNFGTPQDPAPAVAKAQGEDELENDGDGILDMMDTGCAEAADTTEADPPTPRLPRLTATMGSITTATAYSTQRVRAAKRLAQRLRPRSTSIAATASGYIDLADPQCVDAQDTSELPPA